MRDSLKRFISSAVKIAGFFNEDKHCMEGIILLYHSVGDTDKNDYLKLRVDRETFSRQMEYLRKEKYNVITLAQMVNKLNSGKQTQRQKNICITFDDGYADNLTSAAPALKKYGFTATIFITTGYLTGNSKQKKYWEKWEHLTNDNIRELIASGFEVGSHSLSHSVLISLDDINLRREISDSKSVLEKTIKNKTPFLSYPHGSFNKRVENIVREEGYLAACTSITGFNDNKSNLFALKRVEIRGSDSLEDFIDKINGHYNWLGRFQKIKSAINLVDRFDDKDQHA